MRAFKCCPPESPRPAKTYPQPPAAQRQNARRVRRKQPISQRWVLTAIVTVLFCSHWLRCISLCLENHEPCPNFCHPERILAEAKLTSSRSGMTKDYRRNSFRFLKGFSFCFPTFVSSHAFRKENYLAITGSIAAYKTPALVRLLLKAGAEVQVLMTDAATGLYRHSR